MPWRRRYPRRRANVTEVDAHRREREPAQVEQPHAIQLQRRNGRPADRRHAEDLREIHTPCRMIFPAMLPGVEQRNDVIAYGISGPSLREFVIIATLAGQGRIGQDRTTSPASGPNMFHTETLLREVRRAAAVFAQSAGALVHAGAQRQLRASFSHGWAVP